jgi:hypothetical protein
MLYGGEGGSGRQAARPEMFALVVLLAATLPLRASDAVGGLSCWRTPNFAHHGSGDGGSGGGLPPLPTTGRWAVDPWALNESTAVFFVGNSTRMETPSEYQSDSRWGVMGYSWNVNNIGSGNKHAERWESEEAEAIRRYNPNSKVMVTREVQASNCP